MNYRNINTTRQFKDATSHSKDSFLTLLSAFEATFLEQNGQSYEAYIEENVTESPKFKNLGDAFSQIK